MAAQERKRHEREHGFTLVEMLITIVVVGVLTAVAIVGIGGLTDNGSVSACKASADAAKAASVVFYANAKPNVFPADFHDLTTPTDDYDIPNGVAPQAPGVGVVALAGQGWTLKMTPGTATVPPKFTCS